MNNRILGGYPTMKKNTKIFIATAVALVLLTVGVVVGVQKYQAYYEATYIVIDEVKYRRDVTAADLSGGEIREFEKLKELTCLESLDLRDTGITAQQYDSLHAQLPGCSIHWSVPFQGGYCDSEITELTLTELSADDLDALAYMSALSSIQAEACRDYTAIMELMERYPDISISYTVEIDGTAYTGVAQTLNVSDPDINELTQKLSYLPNITTVNLTGQLPANGELLALQQAFPGVTFVFDFEIFGVSVNTLDEFVDLSDIKIASAEEVDAIIPHFYNLTQMDMVNCGISNEEMDALNKRYPSTKIVWTVNVCGVFLRTDAKHFMPVQYHCSGASGAQCYNLRYCTDMQVIDLGHYGTNNVDFVEHMPNLKYLLLCEANLDNEDVIAIGNCTSLEYLELQVTQITDFWPLTNLINLRDLNIAATPCRNWSYGVFGDYTPLMQMQWLDRLWVPFTRLPAATRNALQEALPNTTIVFNASGATTSGYRYTPRYYEQRDILGMYYGTN